MTCQRCDTPLPPGHRKWCSENCRKRACDDMHRATCTRCGNPAGPRTGWDAEGRVQGRCDLCRRREDRERRDARLQLVADLYNQGKSTRAIAEALGYGPNSIPHEVTEARQAGLIGYRYRGYGAAS